jgi:DNA primase
MGTALTDRQLKELGRLTHRLFLCFDADAAGQEATLRGMELAVAQGFDVRVVSLPRGQDPADAPDGFEERLDGAASYLLHRVRHELDHSSDRQEAFVRAREVLARAEDSPERHDALRLLADRLELPRETLGGIAPARAATIAASPSRLLDAGDRLERDALAACVANPSLRTLLGELAPEHFDSDVHRRFREALLDGEPESDDLLALRAELDALAAQERLDERAGTELLLRLRERRLRRELDVAAGDLERVTELQAQLARVRQALGELA